MTLIKLSKPQHEFLTTPHPYPAFVAGFGSGKTQAAVYRTIALKFDQPPLNFAYYMPTYDLIARTAFPRFEQVFDELKIRAKFNKVEATITPDGMGAIIFRSMERPDKIVSYETADSILDELDTLPTNKAREVWEKALGRNRQKKTFGKRNTMGVATTPEGFRFVYEAWKKNPSEGYYIIKASTQSNAANLPEGYIDSLKSVYPSNRLAAYLDGEFVNLTSGNVYNDFDRAKCATNETLQPNDILHIGMDFNVGKMAAVVFVIRTNDVACAVDELTGVLDTPSMISMIKSRFSGHRVFVYPDASGGSRKSVNASESDISLLRQAGFQIMVNNRNPAVKDRVLSVNKALRDGFIKINTQKAPSFVEGLEQQCYDKNGEPDKTSGHDHVNDAAGYFITYRYPVAARPAIVTKLGGL